MNRTRIPISTHSVIQIIKMKNLQTNKHNWYIAYTQSRFERKIHTRIQRLGIQSFLPLHKVKRKWSDRIKIVEVPLFPSYVFVNTTSSMVSRLKTINGLSTFLSFNNKLATIKEQEIETIKKVLETETQINIQKGLFYEGKKIIFKDGPFSNLEGVLTKQQGKYRFVVNFDELANSLSVELPVEYLVKYS